MVSMAASSAFALLESFPRSRSPLFLVVGGGGGGGCLPQYSPLIWSSGRRKLKLKSKQSPAESPAAPGIAQRQYQKKNINGDNSNNGDPLGRKVLGKSVVRWITVGMRAMATDFASAELGGESEEQMRHKIGMGRGGSGGPAFVIQAQPYLNAFPMPKGLEADCLKACTHYPTLLDHFQRELRDVLQSLQRSSGIQDWRTTLSWKLLKALVASGILRSAKILNAIFSSCNSKFSLWYDNGESPCYTQTSVKPYACIVTS